MCKAIYMPAGIMIARTPNLTRNTAFGAFLHVSRMSGDTLKITCAIYF